MLLCVFIAHLSVCIVCSLTIFGCALRLKTIFGKVIANSDIMCSLTTFEYVLRSKIIFGKVIE